VDDDERLGVFLEEPFDEDEPFEDGTFGDVGCFGGFACAFEVTRSQWLPT